MHNFIFTYDFIGGYIEYKGERLKEFELINLSGQIVKFIARQGNLEWDVPCFLLENIFYLQLDNKILFSDDINSLTSFSSIDQDANKTLERNGFIAHSMTQFHDVKVVCSFLKYSISQSSSTVTPSFNYALNDAHDYTIDDLFQELRSALLKSIQKFNFSNFVLPISGGMDSRLLLELLLDLSGEIDLSLFTVGTPDSGDVLLAKEIAINLGLSNKHLVVNLDNVSRKDLLENYSATNYMLPLDRILTVPMNNFFEPSTIVSGLYGDVIFADNIEQQRGYRDYLAQEGIIVTNEFDEKIISAYEKLPKFPKLHRTLLRCQKLTRQSFPINKGFSYIAPFVDPMVILIASVVKDKYIYPKIVKRYMRHDLKKYIHQSSLSYFTHPQLIRKLERKLFKLMHHRYRRPYYDIKYLMEIGIKPNEAPIYFL